MTSDARCPQCGREDDELAARLRSLEAERLRPVPPSPYHSAGHEPDIAALLEAMDDVDREA